MPRDLPFANGRMLVNFDFNYNVRDVYWPHVGERNQTQGHINHFGVWVDGEFTWLDDAEWAARDARRGRFAGDGGDAAARAPEPDADVL